ncbi:MAG: trigger factor family protein [Bacteroidales bacterium]|nr:trigger factor family protein [Bacteroidales bacterium]
MNITRECISNLNEIITITVEKNDYAEKVSQRLKEIKKNTTIKGFRQGSAPMYVIEKIYGKNVAFVEIEKYIKEVFEDYIKTNNIQLIATPILLETNLESVLNEECDVVVFKFEVGLKPEINISFNNNVKFNYYLIKVTNDIIDKEIDNIKFKYGKYIKIDEVEKDSFIYLTIKSENFKEKSIYLNLMDIDQSKVDYFIGKKVKDILHFDLKEFLSNEEQIATILNVSKENLPTDKIEIEAEIIYIEKFIPAENNKELWDKLFPDQNINNENEFKENVSKIIKLRFENYSDRLFRKNVWDYIFENYKIELPENFLRKKYRIKDDIEFKDEISILKKDLVIDYFLKSTNLQIQNNEIEKVSNEYIKEYYKRYYNFDLPEEYVRKTTKKLLENENEYINFYYIAGENKMLQYIKENTSLVFQEISFEEFMKLFRENNNKNDKV